MRRVLIALGLIAASVFIAAPASAHNGGDGPCPGTDDVNKFDVNATSVDFGAAPFNVDLEEGEELHYCIKGPAADGHEHGVLEFGDSLVVQSTFFNDNEQQQEISHASFEVVVVDDPTPSPPDEDEVVNGDPGQGGAALPSVGGDSPWILLTGGLLTILGIAILKLTGRVSGPGPGRHARL